MLQEMLIVMVVYCYGGRTGIVRQGYGLWSL